MDEADEGLEGFEQLLERSSLGTAGARRLRARTTVDQKDLVRRLVELRNHVMHAGVAQVDVTAVAALVRSLTKQGHHHLAENVLNASAATPEDGDALWQQILETMTVADVAEQLESMEPAVAQRRRARMLAGFGLAASSVSFADHPVTVAIVDDHEVVLAGVRAWASEDPRGRIQVIASGSRIESVLAGPGRNADVLVLDLSIFGEWVADRIGELAAERRVVAFSAETSDETIRAVLDAGAVSYLTKHEGAEHFIEVVVAAAHDRPYVTPSLALAMLADVSHTRPALSAQEQRALRLWFQRPKKHMVAREMGLSVETVDQYISRARVKYAAVGRPAPNKAAMVARAIEDGLIRPEEVR